MASPRSSAPHPHPLAGATPAGSLEPTRGLRSPDASSPTSTHADGLVDVTDPRSALRVAARSARTVPTHRPYRARVEHPSAPPCAVSSSPGWSNIRPKRSRPSKGAFRCAGLFACTGAEALASRHPQATRGREASPPPRRYRREGLSLARLHDVSRRHQTRRLHLTAGVRPAPDLPAGSLPPGLPRKEGRARVVLIRPYGGRQHHGRC